MHPILQHLIKAVRKAGAYPSPDGTELVPILSASGSEIVGYVTLDTAQETGVTPGTVTASEVVAVDANKDIADFRNVGLVGTLTFGAGGQINADSGTVTLSSNAGTLSKMAGKITTETLTTAAGSAQALTITNTLVAAADLILLTRTGGTSAGGTPLFKAVPGTGSFVVTADNKHASAAFDGTFIFSFLIIKA